jgi:hypothetical protein
MPFYDTHSKAYEVIPKGSPVSVSAAFSIDGDVKPMLFQVEDINGVRTKNHIVGIKYTKNIDSGISYRVYYMAGNQRLECSLNYYPTLNTWYLEM